MEITVNGNVIGEREIARETQYHPADNLEDARRKAAGALVVRELLLQQARRLIVDNGDGPEETLIAALISREVEAPRTDEETCRRFYGNHLDRFRSPDLIEARHILFVAKPDDPEGWVRLVRAYAVLNDPGQRDAALKTAQARYASRPDVLDQLRQAAAAEPMK